MKQLARLLAAYQLLDASFEAERTAASTAATVQVEARQILDDQAYFLLCRGQLEVEISDICREAIRRRRAGTDWHVRRSWYLYNPDDKRLSGLSFEDRAALVLDRDAGRGSAWARAMFHYATRNDIAHGILRSTRIDVSAFVQDCFIIQTALLRNA